MPKASLTGKIYGDIQVVEYLGNKRYKCKCINCGEISERYSTNLKGVLKCYNCSKGFKIDLTGQKFGHLTVMEYNKDTKKWICQCDCGRFIEVKSNNLKHHNTSTCGICGYKEQSQRQIVGDTRVSQTVFKKNKTPNARNTSGHTGVWYNKRKNKWCASIMFCKKNYYLGYYEDINEAIKARELAEEKLYGDFITWYETEFKNDKSKHT